MKRIVASAIAAAALCAASSCGSGAGRWDDVDTVALAGTVIVEDELLRSPLGITASDDNIFVWNSGKSDTLIDMFDLGGHRIRSFLTKGNGENRMPYIEFARYSQLDSALIVGSSAFNGKLMNVTGLSGSAPQLVTRFSFSERIVGSPSDTVVPSSLVMQLENGAIVTANLTPGGMLALYSPQGRFRRFVQPYPDKSLLGDSVPDYALPNFFVMIGGTSPDGKHFATSSKLGDILAFGTATADSVDIVTYTGKPQKGINVVQSPDNYCRVEYNDSLEYFYPFGLALSNSHVYAVTGGIAATFNTGVASMKAGGGAPVYINVYDYEGNPVRVLRVPLGMCRIAVTPDDSRLFAFVESDDNGYQIISFDL
ncbi:MAG: hypothetical protein K2I18_05270 [Paramuribaculum sp.]|nr:hypothetical protein [Paramuribaculum sp.]